MAIMREGTGTKIDSEIMGAFDRAIGAFRAQQPDRFREKFPHIVEREQ